MVMYKEYELTDREYYVLIIIDALRICTADVIAYCVLQLNSAKDAEFMSNLFGTFVTTETTYVSLDQRLGDGVKGTKRLVHEYRISPDEIKGIPPLTAFFYDKRRPDVVYKVKVPFTGG